MNIEHCQKCDGYGYLSYYWHVKNGVCFQCKGKRTREEGSEKPKAPDYKEHYEAVTSLKERIIKTERIVESFKEYPPENEDEETTLVMFKQKLMTYQDELASLKQRRES